MSTLSLSNQTGCTKCAACCWYANTFCPTHDFYCAYVLNTRIPVKSALQEGIGWNRGKGRLLRTDIKFVKQFGVDPLRAARKKGGDNGSLRAGSVTLDGSKANPTPLATGPVALGPDGTWRHLAPGEAAMPAKFGEASRVGIKGQGSGAAQPSGAGNPSLTKGKIVSLKKGKGGAKAGSHALKPRIGPRVKRTTKLMKEKKQHRLSKPVLVF